MCDCEDLRPAICVVCARHAAVIPILPISCSAAQHTAAPCSVGWTAAGKSHPPTSGSPRGTLLEREGGGREKREGEKGGGGIHVKCVHVHGITCLQHTSHNKCMYMYTVMWVRIPPGTAHFFFEKKRK